MTVLPQSSQKVHILLIDDEEMVARSVERHLRLHNFNVTVAISGVDGLNAARRHRPDLTVLDVLMPGMDGFEVCRQLRADPLLGGTPVLFLTARGKTEDRVLGLRAGADDYLSKPYDPEEFILRIRAILRRSQMMEGEDTSTPARITVRDLTLDCKSFTAITPHKSTPLTPMQFDLLYFFMTHPGSVFSSQKLLHDVWGYPFDAGSPDLVRAHIKNLREKIEPDPANPIYVVNMPRFGYAMYA